MLLAYDAHALSVTIPGKSPAKYFKKREATLVIDLTWDGGSSNDMDLYVLDSESNTVASSTFKPSITTESSIRTSACMSFPWAPGNRRSSMAPNTAVRNSIVPLAPSTMR